MGPYCKFCDQRCFVVRTAPDGSWSGCMATCQRGMAQCEEAFGYTHETAVNPVVAAEAGDAYVEVLEDNSGAVYLSMGEATWGLGPVTPDLSSMAAVLAVEWAAGEWVPSEGNGQVPADPEGLDLIATWADGRLTVVRDPARGDEVVAGTGGRAFLGRVAEEVAV